MEIIRKSEGLKAGDLYALTKGNTVRKMQDAKGETIDVSKYVLYTDQDQAGNPMQILSVETAEGVRYATNSKTLVRNFLDIQDIFDQDPEAARPTKYVIGSKRSNGGREYLTCDIAE